MASTLTICERMQMGGSYVLRCGPACSSIFYRVDIVDQAVLLSSTTWAVCTRLFSVSYSMDSTDQVVLLVYSMDSVDQVVLLVYSMGSVDQVVHLVYSMDGVDQAVILSPTAWTVWTRLFSIMGSLPPLLEGWSCQFNRFIIIGDVPKWHTEVSNAELCDPKL